MAGYIQVPADSVGKRVDTVTLTDAGVEVHRQKIVMTGGSGTAEVVVVTDSSPGASDMALVVRQAGTALVAISTPFTIQAISATTVISGLVGLTAGTSVIGDINAISRTVQVAIATPFTLQGISTTVNVAIATPFVLQGISTTVNVAIATPFTVNNISATVVTGLSYVTEKTTNSQVQVGDSANAAIRVNIVAGSAAGVSFTDGTPFTAQAAAMVPIGGIFDDAAPDTLSEGDAGVVRMTTNRAIHMNIRDAAGNELGATSATGLFIRTATVTFAGGIAISGTAIVAGVVGLTAGTAVIGDINAISRTVQVAIATPFTLQGISTTVQVAISTPFILQGISTTVQVAIGTPFTLNNISATVTVAGIVAVGPTAIMSASHGPKCVTCSTSAVVTLVATPGAGQSIYITQLAVSNEGAAGSRARIGTSASGSTIMMFCASAGGGFVMNFDPPWKLSASEAAVCSVKPNTSMLFNVNFYVAP